MEGVREQLGYIKALGAGAIWLTPVVKNIPYEDTVYHGYGIQDFLTIDPRFASDPAAARANPQLAEKELRRLVDEARPRSLRYSGRRSQSRWQRLWLRSRFGTK